MIKDRSKVNADFRKKNTLGKLYVDVLSRNVAMFQLLFNNITGTV